MNSVRAASGILTAVTLYIVIALSVVSVRATPAPSPAISADALAPIGDIVEQEIASGHVPGAVVLVGHGDEIIYRRAFGLRATRPQPVAMTADTIFDLASLTKVVATTTAVMQLVERGRLDLDQSASTYWPAFGAAGKQTITIRDLLTHYSGLRPDLNLNRPWFGYGTAMRMLVAERPLYPSGARYVYSDENFEVLGEIVRRLSGMSLAQYCEEHIFTPLQMMETRFGPSLTHAERVAPTSSSRSADVSVVVHDPTALRMNGIAGHAGLFSTADDLAIFAKMLLDGGSAGGARVLNRESIASMTRPQSPPTGSRLRGLGWDLSLPIASNDEEGARTGAYEHSGYTGTMMWLDPGSRSYVIVLSNRTYQGGRGDAQPLRKAILSQVSAALGS